MVPLESAPEPARGGGGRRVSTLRGRRRLLRALRERPGAMVHPCRRRQAQRRRPAASGWVKHVTVAAFILLSGNVPLPITTMIWCFGGSKFVDMTDCVVWGDMDKFNYSARNTCNEYLNLTVVGPAINITTSTINVTNHIRFPQPPTRG